MRRHSRRLRSGNAIARFIIANSTWRRGDHQIANITAEHSQRIQNGNPGQAEKSRGTVAHRQEHGQSLRPAQSGERRTLARRDSSVDRAGGGRFDNASRVGSRPAFR